MLGGMTHTGTLPDRFKAVRRALEATGATEPPPHLVWRLAALITTDVDYADAAINRDDSARRTYSGQAFVLAGGQVVQAELINAPQDPDERGPAVGTVAVRTWPRRDLLRLALAPDVEERLNSDGAWTGLNQDGSSGIPWDFAVTLEYPTAKVRLPLPGGASLTRDRINAAFTALPLFVADMLTSD